MCFMQVGNLPGAVRMLKENPRSQLEVSIRASMACVTFGLPLEHAAIAIGCRPLRNL